MYFAVEGAQGMQRLFALLTVVMFGLFLSNVFAQNFMGGPATPAQAATTPAAPSGHVMNSEQFKATVNTLSKQTDANLTQQVDDSLAAGGNKPMPAPPSSLPTQPTATPTAPDATPEMPGPTNNPPPPPTITKLPPRPAPSTPQTPPPSSAEVYTGFGGGQTNQKNGGGNSGGNSGNKSSNWNVGY
jgi:hypothetical protein